MITSTQNPTIKDLVRLRDRRHRDRSGTFLVEGYRELGRAIGNEVALESLFVCPSLFLGSNEAELIAAARARDVAIVELGEAAFRKVSYRDRPEGLLGVASQFDIGIARIDLTGNPLFLVVEAIEKPGNLGTMLRTADAAGCRAVIVCDPATDPFNPNVVRASLGTLFTVPLAVADSSGALWRLADAGVGSVAMTPSAADPLYFVDLTGPSAIVIGSEQYGLSDVWLDNATKRARLPMAGSADSLNAAMAAGISLFEAVRQRLT